ncbi:MAG: TonB-dependent receptor plug domain-containing protein, partial [Steroidobacteraceae bacterium]
MARSRILKPAVTGLLTGAATLASPGALAQLEEIVVTAERREASVQDVPIAVSAYGEQLMEDLQLEDTIDLINVVPNLFGGNNTGLGTANMYYLRAQGNDESIATFDPPVGTYVDDIYITRQNANNFSLFDVERIEVLRGPQGTLYGRNTTGGAISLVMRKPGDTLGGYL